MADLPTAAQAFANGPLEADFCVVGSGPAGAIVALELAAAGRDVLLLEAGGTAPGADATSTLGRLDLPGETDLQFGRAFQVGGSSNLWAGRVAPLERIDFEPRPWMKVAGWPIRVEELADGYARAFKLMGLHEPRIALPPRPDGLGPMMEREGLEVKSFAWSRPPFNIGTVVQERVKQGTGPRVVTEAPVVALREAADGGSIESAEVALPGGGRGVVRAKRFVLASGGLEVPRLLLASTGVRAKGIGNDHDLVGRYFSTHPKADMAALVLNKRVKVRHALFSDQPVDGIPARYGIGLTAEAQRQHRLPNHYVQLSPLLEFQASRAFEKVRGSSAIKSPLIDRSALLKGLLPSLGVFTYEMIGKLAGLQPGARTFILRAFLDQIPDPAHRITLSEKKDAHGVPLVDISWRLTLEDRETILRFFERLDASVRGAGIGRVEFGGLKSKGEWPITAIHSHFMGTTRMGETERDGVVDRDMKVFGSANLYVSGPSVFTAYGYSNPYLTIAALAYRLADHLKSLA